MSGQALIKNVGMVVIGLLATGLLFRFAGNLPVIEDARKGLT